MMKMGYEQYLREYNKEDCKESYIDWEVNILGMRYIEAVREANDPETGYER